MNQKTLPLHFIFLISSHLLLAQTGPGGVEGSNNLVMWLDASQEGFSNGASVTTWSDQSGNGNSVSGATSPPTFQTNQINGLPSIEFDGVAYLESGGLSELSNQDELTWIIVGSGNTGSQNGVFLGSNYSSGNYKFGTRVLNGNFQALLRLTSGSFNILSTNYTNGFHILTNTWSSTSGNRISQLDNLTFGSNSISTSTTDNNTYISIGKNPNNASGNLNGNIAEILLYRTFLNGTQRTIINNHLAAKYALTIANDKFAFDGTHGNEVAGIGQESAGDNHTDAQGTAIVRINGANDLDNGEYLMWGHDGAAQTGTTSELPTAFGGTGSKLTREWRASETGGDVGTVDITFNMTGITLGPDPNGYRILTDADGNFGNANINPTIVPVVNGSLITFNNVDLSSEPFFTIGHNADVGECVSFFNATANWNAGPLSTWDCGFTPDSTSNVIIDVGFTRTVTGVQTVNDLSVDGTLELVANSTLVIKGNLTVTGNVVSDPSSTVIFRGSSGNLQLVDNSSGGTVEFGNLHINNPNNVRFFAGDFALSGGLHLIEGAYQNTTNLTFRSTAASQGHLASIGTGSFIGSGSYTVERFISGRPTYWNCIATPGIATTISDLDDEIFISGVVGADGYAAAAGGGSFISIWYFDNATDQYEPVGNVTDAMPLGRGYEAWLGDDMVSWIPKAWNANGSTLNTGITGIDISGPGGGWNLIGNPLPAFLDFAAINADYPSIVGDEFWYFDADSMMYNHRGPNAMIPPGQGFWINSSSSVTMNIDPALHIRSDLNTSEFFKSQREELKLEVHNTSEPFASAVYLRKDENAFTGMDARDLPPLKVQDPRAVNVSMEFSGEESMLNYVNTSEAHLEIPVVVEAGMPGKYEVKLKGLHHFDEYQCVNLYNEETGEQYEVSAGASYQFDIAEDLNPLRLKLLFSKEDYEDCMSPTAFAENDIRVFAHSKTIIADFYLDRNATADIHIYNVLGEQVYKAPHNVGYSREEINLDNLETGVYFVNILMNGQSTTEKVILK